MRAGELYRQNNKPGSRQLKLMSMHCPVADAVERLGTQCAGLALECHEAGLFDSVSNAMPPLGVTDRVERARHAMTLGANEAPGTVINPMHATLHPIEAPDYGRD